MVVKIININCIKKYNIKIISNKVYKITNNNNNF